MTTLLDVVDVSVSLDGFKAINNLSLSIGEPELRAVIGPNGAGKTTFMDIVTGKTRPDSGKVLWRERRVDLLKLSESGIAQAGIGRKFQKPMVFEEQSVRDNLLMALSNRRGPFFVLAWRETAADHARLVTLAEEIGLPERLDDRAGDLSHEQKQWLEIGMLLAQDPRLLLVDEPAAGMTPAERAHTTDLLKRAASTRAVMVIEHDMEFIRRLDCRVTVLHEGSVLAEGSLEHVTRNQQVIDVCLGRRAMLTVDNLTLHYGASHILHGVSLEARPGSVTAVMGTNGVGKTSLLRAMAGRHPSSGGTITLDGKPMNHHTAAQAARAGIGYVPQGREIFPLLTVTENLQTGLACLPRSERRIPERIHDLFPVLRQMKDRRGGDLSGGQQQQPAIARALIARPRVLLFDEPTEGIQPNIIKQIGKVIELLRQEGEIAIVLVEQYFDFAYRLADSFCVLNRGEVVLSRPKSNITRQEILDRVSI